MDGSLGRESQATVRIYLAIKTYVGHPQLNNDPPPSNFHEKISIRAGSVAVSEPECAAQLETLKHC